MSTVGYYRYKIKPTESQEVSIYVNGVLTSTKSVVVKDVCSGFRLLKYIDRDSQYRFYPFNKFWESDDKPKLIGKSNKIIENILNSQASENNIGYKNKRTVSLVAESVSQEELTTLSDIYTSPRVYLYIGSGTDLAQDWLEVDIKGDNKNRLRKRKFTKVEIEVTLPEWYSISMM
jgi:hypothetical protein